MTAREERPTGRCALLSCCVLLLLLAGCGEVRRYNILLVSIDSLRADHLNAYGYTARKTTPEIDRIAERGVLFEKAYAHAPWTIPSQMSLLTSLYPSSIGFNVDVREFVEDPPVLPSRARTLAEVIQSEGFRTAAFSDGGPLFAHFGFSRGFDRFENSEERESSLEERCVELLEWIGQDTEPFFALLHTFEAHQPYPEVEENSSTLEEELSARYDAGIRAVDAILGERLLEPLRQRGLLDQTILLITSDHGEALFDHVVGNRGDDHGYHLYDELLHVPLLLLVPNERFDAGRVAAPVQLVDVMPTLLSLVEADLSDLIRQGEDLVPLLQGEALPPRSLLAEAPFQGSGWGSIRRDGQKFIRTLRPSPETSAEEEEWWMRIALPERALFNLADDPKEQVNLAERLPEASARLEKELMRAWEQNSRLFEFLGSNGSGERDSKTADYLRSLGYIR